MLAPPVVSKKTTSTLHREKRLKDTETVLEDGRGKKPRPVTSRDHTLNSEENSYVTIAHNVNALTPKTVLPQTALRKTRKNPLAWPPHDKAETPMQRQGLPPSRVQQ